MIYMQVQETV